MTYGQRVLILVVCWLMVCILFVAYFLDQTGGSGEAQVWGGLSLPIILTGAGNFVFMGRRQFPSREMQAQESINPPRPVKPIPFWISLILAFFAIAAGNIVVTLLLPLLR